MVLTQFASEGLDGLCSQEQLQLLDAIDSLRSQGISHYISLPQIIVCGDQSSGKSSVLEAISGVSFPVQSSLCTRFPTELILRKTSHISVKVSIVAHHSRTEDEKASLSGFHEKLETFQGLPSLIENAKAAMGIMTLGKAFSKDLLRIEISGPDRPHLTIVDLPGLIHSENKHQSASDIDLITEVVQSYMKEPRSIILAVVSAKNDYANQIVLKLARKADATGTRTLGVITKPDTLTPGSGSEKMFISLAKNMDVEFSLGWHVLRNRDTDAEIWTLAQRDHHESEFFSSGSWASLQASNLGIKALRGRLSKLLLFQIASELPNLMEEISAKSAMCQLQLAKLGSQRTNAQEQRLYLIQLGQSFQSIVQAAVEGTYTNPYFGDAMTEVGYHKRIRAVVQNLSRDFAASLSREGRKHEIIMDEEGSQWPGFKSRVIKRSDFIEKINNLIDRSRGRELPGASSPMVIADLFKEQSSPWREIAENHVENVWNAVRVFLRLVISYVADGSVVDTIQAKVVEPRLANILACLRDKTSALVEPHQSGHPITYNLSFVKNLHKIRSERLSAQFKNTLQGTFGSVSLTGSTYVSGHDVNFGTIIARLVEQTEIELKDYNASEILDYLNAYYDIALKRFIDDISVEVIETCLIAELKQILSPMTVAMMSEGDLAYIAGETDESRATRDDLERKLKVLGRGEKTCRKFAGISVSGLGKKHDKATSNTVDIFNDSVDSSDDHANEVAEYVNGDEVVEPGEDDGVVVLEDSNGDPPRVGKSKKKKKKLSRRSPSSIEEPY